MCRSIILLSSMLMLCSAGVWAEDARKYCAEMYPADAYEAVERTFYFNECMENYADDNSSTEDVVYEEESSNDEYQEVDSNVEDYVEDLEEEQYQEE